MNDVLTTLYTELLPILLQLIGALLGILLMRAAATAKARWGIEIEARHREALHSALMSGVTAALMKGLSGKEVVDAAIAHAARSVPDALAALAPSTEVLTSLASSKLRDAHPLQYVVTDGLLNKRPSE
jgi:anti-sigma factor RsiW